MAHNDYKPEMSSKGWATMSADNKAWEFAKVVCGPDAILADIIAKCEELKVTLAAEAK